MSKISPKLMACFRGVVANLSWLKIHQTKRTTYDYHHLKGFQDRSTHTRYMGQLLISTNPETPCSIRCVLKELKFLAIYVSEISHKTLRNTVGMLPSQFVATGFLMSYVLGYKCGWRITSLICSIISGLAALLALFILPETPYWLVQHDRVKEAQEEEWYM